MTLASALAVPTRRMTTRRVLKPGVGVLVVAALFWWLGAGPFLHGLRQLNATAIALGVAVGVLTTVAAAQRWRTIAASYGVTLTLRAAVAYYYRSQFLNSVLPAGVLGDVHRVAATGRESGDTGAAVRAAVLDRAAGQLVQIALAVPVLLFTSTQFPIPLPMVAGAMTVGVAVAVVLLRRSCLFRLKIWPVVTGTSLVVVLGHLLTFLYAAHRAGTTATPVVAMLALLAMSVPLGIGGWGPREGVTAWLFGVVGLGASAGLATSTVYSVMSLCGCLPGAVVLIRRRQRARWTGDVRDA